MRLGWTEKWLIDTPLREFVQKVFGGGNFHDWQSALLEIHRVIERGGRFYIEEITRQFIVHAEFIRPGTRWHP